MLGGNQVRMGFTYARSLLSFAVDGAPRPFSAAFNVTDRCNLRCEYCNFTSFAGPELRWKTAWNRETTCTRCNVGPMLEFNLLYKHPIRAALNVLRSYA